MIGLKDMILHAWVAGLLILGVMKLGQRVWECVRQSQRSRIGWIYRASDFLLHVEYFVALVLSVTMYAGFFHYVVLRPTEFSVAMVIPAGLTICVLVATWRGSAKPAIRLWKETNGLRVMKRGLWSLGAFSFPFQVPDAFDAWRGRNGTEVFFRKVGNR